MLALILPVLLLSACAPAEQTAAGEEVSLWFAVREGGGREGSSAVARETRLWQREPSALDLMGELLKGPENEEELVSPFPKGVEVLALTVDGDTATATVNLSEQYGGLAGFDLTVADYCVALTLCQLPEVETVKVLVDGESIPYRGRQELRAGDVLLSEIGEEPDAFLAVLFFPDRDGERLRVEYRRVAREGGEAVEIALRELLRGPADGEACLPLPEGTAVRSVAVNGGVCQVNLSSAFLDNAPEEEGRAALALYAVVNTLCALGGVSQTRLLVEGESVMEYGGVAANAPLSANFDLVDG